MHAAIACILFLCLSFVTATDRKPLSLRFAVSRNRGILSSLKRLILGDELDGLWWSAKPVGHEGSLLLDYQVPGSEF